MRYEDFVNAVKDRAGLSTDREALIASEATLKTLGERLSEKEAASLAAQLPPLIGRFLTVVDMDKEYDLDGFYEHIAAREGLDLDVSRKHAQAVLQVVDDIVSPGELREALGNLPEEFHSLFTFGGDRQQTE